MEGRKLSDGPEHLFSVRADKGAHCRSRWERHQKDNQNPTLFKVLEMNSFSEKKAGPYFIIHMLLRDTSGDLEGGF